MLYEINEKAIRLEGQGKKIVKLNLGDPDQQTHREIVEAAYKAMKQGKTKYGSSAGEKRLRERLAEIYGVPADGVVITAGSKWAIFSIMYALLKNGGNIVLPTPYWTAYELAAKSLGAEVRFVRTELKSDWRIDTHKLDELVDKNTKLIVLSNPNNPTSKVIDGRLFQEIVEIADKKNTTIMSDEIYADISFVKVKSILDYNKRHIVVHGFSKTFAMTGWRIGYAIVGKELADKMIKLNQMTITNVPIFIQEAALRALDLRQEIADEMREEYKRRADLACSILSRTKMKFSKPDAPFYVFPKYEGLDSEKFALDLLDKGVAITPGSSFGDYREHFRIALTLPDNEVELGLKKIREALQ
jgi:aspartate aminotransferase